MPVFRRLLMIAAVSGGLCRAAAGWGQTDAPEAEAAPVPPPGPPLPAGKQAGNLANWKPGSDGRLQPRIRPRAEEPGAVLPDLKPEEPLITVNGDTLAWGAMLRHAELMIAGMPLPQGVAMEDFEAERDSILLRRIMRLAENYIVKTLFAQEARRHNLSLAPQEVEAKREAVFAEVRKRRNPEPHLQEYTRPGSYFAYDLTNSLLFAKLKQEVIRPSLAVTDQDILGAILKRVEKNGEILRANAGLRPKIEGLLAKIKAGESFADIAFAESDCDTSYDGGEWGTFKYEDLRPELMDAAFAMEEGELSDVVETPFSFHIIKLLKKNRGIQPAGRKKPAPAVSVKIAHIMLEKKRPLPPHTPETARREIMETRESEAVEAMKERLLEAARIETPLPLY